MKNVKLLFLLIFFTQIFAEPVDTGHAKVALIKGDYVNGQLTIGIKMDMQENWHTYWKNPGDSGGPIKVKWSKDKNIAAVSDILWPAPELIPYPPLMTYGYKNFVIFPFKITFTGENNYLEDLEPNTVIGADIDFLICDDVCVPEKALISTTISEMKYGWSNYAPKNKNIDYWISRVPDQTLPTKIKIDNNFLEIRFSYNNKINNIYFYIEEQWVVAHAEKQVLIKEENNWLLRVPLDKDVNPDRLVNGVITIEDGYSNVNNYLVSSETESQKTQSLNITFIQAIIFAFIGGLILNLMPCVFPVIALKILSFVSMGNESKTKIRQHALAFCAGVLLSFLLIGITMVMLKEAGSYLGWGFQLQSPIIVGMLSILMFVIGIILLTDINIGASLTRLGSVGSNKLSGSFLTGVLAVIVASPCTAPFMGAALGYALIQPSGITIPIFASLGIGFATPYLILSISPNLIKFLPRPGKWMVTLKEFFAFPMFATSLWLIWIFSLQTNISLLISLLISILIISLLFWWISKVVNKKILLVIWLIVFSTIIFEGIYIKSNEVGLVTRIQQLEEEAWDLNIEENFKDNNQAYLINFTAAWCITCQANDKIALSRPKVKQYIKDNDIKYIVADWTNKNDEILKALESYNRSGVPLYIYWKPGMQESRILPAILTESLLLDILKSD